MGTNNKKVSTACTHSWQQKMHPFVGHTAMMAAGPWLAMRLLMIMLLLGSSAVFAQSTAEKPKKAVAVEILPITAVNFSSQTSYSGSVRASRQTQIKAKSDGYVEEIRYQAGEKIQTGQSVLKIDAALTQAKLTAARVGLENGLLDIYQQEYELKNLIHRARASALSYAIAQDQMLSEQALLEQGYSSSQNIRSTQSQLESMRSVALRDQLLLNGIDTTDTLKQNLQAAIRQQQAAGLSVESVRIPQTAAKAYLPLARAILGFQAAQTNFQNTLHLYQSNFAIAPFSGHVLQVMVDLGENVNPGTPLVEIGNIDKLLIELYISEKDRAYFNNNNPAITVTLDSNPNRQIVGKQKNISLSADPSNRGYRLVIEIANTKKDILIGSNAKVNIELYNFKDQIVVPINALLQDANGSYLFLAQDAVAKKQPVVVKHIFSDKAILQSGVQLGDQVIVKGQQFLKEQDLLNIKQ